MKELPVALKAAMKKRGCEVAPGSVYDEGYKADIKGDGSVAYEFCCHEAPHGPCISMIWIRKGRSWQRIGEKTLFGDLCVDMRVLEEQHEGFHDLCFGYEGVSKDVEHWRFVKGSYRQVR